MKTFRMKADVTFEAEDIDDAFEKMSNHFKNLIWYIDFPLVFTSGEITIKPISEEEK